jgi:hypothetical protein
LHDTNILINAACPGFCATGAFFDDADVVPW